MTDMTFPSQGVPQIPAPTPARSEAVKRTKKQPKKLAGVDRAMVRRIASKVVTLQDADAGQRSALAVVLGVKDDPVELTVAVMAPDKPATTPLSDLQKISEASSDMDAALAYMMLPPPRQKSVWSLAVALDLGIPKTRPPSDADAAKHIAAAALSLEEAQRNQLAAVTTLARKGA